MNLRSFASYKSPHGGIALPVLAVFVMAGLAVGGTPGSRGPNVLVVPSSGVPLQVATPMSARYYVPHTPKAWEMMDVDHPDSTVLAQAVCESAEDGTATPKGRTLLAGIPPRKGAEGPRRFSLREPRVSSIPFEGKCFRFKEINDKSLQLLDVDEPVLVYNHGPITSEKVPESDRRRSRACYVHPLWGLNGEVLTDDFPKDHYHHHGIFWTWPHIGIEGKQYNLWDGAKIKDKFVRWICREVGPVAAVLAVENGWFVEEKKVMIERVWLRTYKVADGARTLDIEFTWIPVDKPVTLWGAGGKSYGGLTVRFAVGKAKEAVITVPSGRTADDLYEAPLAWVDLTYPFQGAAAPSGAAVFVHPDHPDYPPTWLTRHYGPLCVGWPGVKAKTFEPGKPIRLDYRIWIHKGAVELDDLKRAYEGYTTATKVKWE